MQVLSPHSDCSSRRSELFMGAVNTSRPEQLGIAGSRNKTLGDVPLWKRNRR